MCDRSPNDIGLLSQEQLLGLHQQATANMKKVYDAIREDDGERAVSLMSRICGDEYAMTYAVWRRPDGILDCLPLRGWDHARETHTSGTSSHFYVGCYDPGNEEAAQAHCEIFEANPDARWEIVKVDGKAGIRPRQAPPICNF